MTTLPWDHRPNPPSREELAAFAAERGVSLDVPAGARKFPLRCTNCRLMDRLRNPELGNLYCWGCPVSKRQRRKGD